MKRVDIGVKGGLRSTFTTEQCLKLVEDIEPTMKVRRSAVKGLKDAYGYKIGYKILM